MVQVALIGDFNPAVIAHQAIPPALTLAGENRGRPVTWDWIETETISDAPRQLSPYDAIWCVPASPYRNMAGALAAIRFARESGRPFLGTCGGFQHALIEFAREVAGIAAADHAETNASADDLVVTPLACSLVEQSGGITFTPGSQLHGIFAGQSTQEGYHCRYGVNPAYLARLETVGLRFTGLDAAGDIRAFELPGHPFFVGTLFQPERSALRGLRHPLIETFLTAIHA